MDLWRHKKEVRSRRKKRSRRKRWGERDSRIEQKEGEENERRNY